MEQEFDKHPDISPELTHELSSEKRGINQDSDERDSNEKLFYAILKKNSSEKEKLAKIERIFEEHPRPNIKTQYDNGYMDTPLHMVVRLNYLKIVCFLLTQGADITLKNDEGITPKELAEKLNSHQIVAALEARIKSSPQEVSAWPNDFSPGTALGGGDCFFDTLAQGMNRLKLEEAFDVKSLRKACFDYANNNKEVVYDSNTDKSWGQAIAVDARDGGYSTNSVNEIDNLNRYLACITLTAQDKNELKALNLDQPIWGRPEIEGRMYCKKYGIKIHLIEYQTVDNLKIIIHHLIDSSGSSSVSEQNVSLLYNDPQVVHIYNGGLAHFVPILNKTKVPNIRIEKQALSSSLERGQSQDNPTERSSDYPVQPSAINSQQEHAIPTENKALIPPNVEKLTLQKASEQLLIAAEEGVKEDIISAIAHGADINYLDKYTKQSAIDIAWENADYDIMLALLKADSNFPKEFTLDALYQDIDIPDEIKDYVKDREQLHIWLKEDDKEKIAKFVSEHGEKKFLNSENKPALEVAAEHAGVETLSALLRISRPTQCLCTQQKELLALTDVHGNTPFLIAAQREDPETLKLLIQCGVDISYKRKIGNPVTAIELAWDKKRYSNVLALLEVDSPFPSRFDMKDLQVAALRTLVERRKTFHKALAEPEKNDAWDTVQTFIKDHPRLKKAYNPHNQFAYTTALQAKNYRCCAFLQSKGFEKDELLKLTEEQQNELKSANLEYFKGDDNAHIIYLVSKSKLGLGQEKNDFYNSIKKLYEQLDSIPQISTILKVVEQSEATEIIFDFNKHSIIDLDPTQSPTAAGACDYKEGRIYIGAKQQSEGDLLGTLAHELAHLAMQVRYDNDCNPYAKLDAKEKSRFEEIVKKYQVKQNADEIIKRVYDAYKNTPNVWPSELIVRVPHLLANYIGEQNKEQFIQRASELFEYYNDKTNKDLEEFVKTPYYYKSRRLVQRLNNLSGPLEKIKQDNILLNSERLLSNEAFDSEMIQLLSSSLPQLTYLNLYQVLRISKSLSDSDIKSGYIFIAANQFRKPKLDEHIFNACHSHNSPTVIVDCSYDYELSQQDLWSTIDSFKEKKRIIFVADFNTAKLVKNNPNKIKINLQIDEDYKWSDLTLESQQKLLEKKVNFQGNKIALNQLMTPESLITEHLPLADLLEGKALKIGKTLPVSNGYDESFYIDRTFNQSKTDQNDAVSYPPKDLKDFLQQAKLRKVMLISDTAGMGKTTVLTSLSKEIKQADPHHWVVRIDLDNHTTILEVQKKKKKSAEEFLTQLIELENPLEKNLFIQSIQTDSVVKLSLLFDGFDEISPSFKDTVIDLLKTLKDSAVHQLWITTRPYQKDALEYELGIFSYTLEPFSEENQIDFLVKFWATSLGENNKNPRLILYAETLVITFIISIKDNEKRFTGIPLQLRMLAEIFERKQEKSELPEEIKNEIETIEEGAKEFIGSQTPRPNIPKKINLRSLYKTFIYKKYYEVYVREKVNAKTVAAKDELQNSYPSFIEAHHILSLYALLSEEQCETLLSKEQMEKIETLINSIKKGKERKGIVDQIIKNKPHFVHRTFSEFLMADFLVEQLQKESPSKGFQEFLLTKIFISWNYEVVRSFVNFSLEEIKLPETTLELYGNRMECLYTDTKERHVLLWTATQEENINIIQFVAGSLELGKHVDTLKKLLQYKDGRLRSVWHVALEHNNLELLEKLLEQADSKKDLLLSKDRHEEIPWEIAAQHGYIELLRKLWDYGKKEEGVDIKNDMLFHKDYYGYTAWLWAAWKGQLKVLDELWRFGKEIELGSQDFKHLLLGENIYQQTSLHLAAQAGHTKVLDKLWGFGKEIELKPHELKGPLLSPCDQINSSWCAAVQEGHLEVLEKLWEFGKEVKIEKNEFIKVLQNVDMNKHNIWFFAALKQNTDIIEKLLYFVKESEITRKEYKKMLLQKNFKGKTCVEYLQSYKKGDEHKNTVIIRLLESYYPESQMQIMSELFNLIKEFSPMSLWRRAPQ